MGSMSGPPLPTSPPVVNASSLAGTPLTSIGPSTPPNLPGPLGPLPPGAGTPFIPPLGPDSAFYPLSVSPAGQANTLHVFISATDETTRGRMSDALTRVRLCHREASSGRYQQLTSTTT